MKHGSLFLNRFFPLIILGALLIGFYPLTYLFVSDEFGLLASKSSDLLASRLWRTGFYTHIFLGGAALLVGWPQFLPRLRRSRPRFHRQLGRVYVYAVLFSALAGIGIGLRATGGWIPASGFISLGIFWFTTTLLAFLHARRGRYLAHQKMMILSYAACFAAVTLRIWLPLLTAAFGDFLAAYRVVAWLCWVPNVGVGIFLMRKVIAPLQK